MSGFLIPNSFNPCFNGTMYKNLSVCLQVLFCYVCFNPCFNGTMYKNWHYNSLGFSNEYVSILVLMELCIKTGSGVIFISPDEECFNPCFNGTMYKNSIENPIHGNIHTCFNPCFNGTMYKNCFAMLC